MFRVQCAVWSFPLWLLTCGIVQGERPSAPRLVPKSTVGYARVENVEELRTATVNSSIGRMLQDEQLKPLVGDVYVIGEQLFNEVSDRLGLTLDELLNLAQGEVAFALYPLESTNEEAKEESPRDNSPEAIRARIEARRNRFPFGIVLIVETGNSTPQMRTLFNRVEEQMLGRIEKTVRTVKGTDVVTYARGNQPPFSYAEKENTFVMGLGAGVVDDVLRRWAGEADLETLAQSNNFGNVMSHCVGAEETRPQLTFYADPYTLVERIVRSAGGPAAIAWPILESLQIDKIKGIGGSTFTGADDDFESIAHVHILLDSPRDGLLSVVRPGEGSTQPEDWVPADLVSYTTLRWDFSKTYEGIGRIVGRFQSADAMERLVEGPFKERTEVDLKKDILEQLTGRLSILRWNEPPVRINSAAQIWALEVRDIAQFEATLSTLNEKFNVRLEKGSYGGQVMFTDPLQGGGRDAGRPVPENFRRPEAAVALIGNYVVASDSRKAIEHLIDTLGGRASRLSASPDYDLIAGEVSGKLDARKPFLFSYIRNEEALRPIYELARDPQNREFLRRAVGGDNQANQNPRGPLGANRYLKMLLDTMDKHELPAFSAFSKYFAPSGGFAYDDPTGVHYAIFSLKPIE